jgi:hypothetical protein
MSRQLSLQIGEDGATDDRLDALTGYLREELLDLDVDDVRRPSGGEAPPGTRAVDLAAVGALIVTVGQATVSIKDVVAVVRGWLSRGDGVRRTVKIELDGDVLELSEVSKAEQDRLVALFVDRHAQAGPTGERPA